MEKCRFGRSLPPVPQRGMWLPGLLPYRLNYGWAAPVYRDEMNGNNVSGIVSDAITHEPLIGATVKIPGTTIGCATVSTAVIR